MIIEGLQQPIRAITVQSLPTADGTPPRDGQETTSVPRAGLQRRGLLTTHISHGQALGLVLTSEARISCPLVPLAPRPAAADIDLWPAVLLCKLALL